ncbi:hypothetical protein [Brevibacillus sp. H7]|uniref:hypothetical protein n=1 Tax=Brevibacillus sp. H7 TaxID=3349138 RepID=UPI003817F6B9
MYSVQPYLFEVVSNHARCFQAEVDQLAKRFSLRIEGGFPSLELHVHPHFQALLDYTLWGEAGVVAIRGKLQFQNEQISQCEPFPVSMKFSLSYDPGLDIESKKQRIEEIFSGDVDLFWNIPPAGHVGHVELSLSFVYRPESGDLYEYTRFVLGILTGKVLAA